MPDRTEGKKSYERKIKVFGNYGIEYNDSPLAPPQSYRLLRRNFPSHLFSRLKQSVAFPHI